MTSLPVFSIQGEVSCCISYQNTLAAELLFCIVGLLYARFVSQIFILLDSHQNRVLDNYNIVCTRYCTECCSVCVCALVCVCVSLCVCVCVVSVFVCVWARVLSTSC